MIDVHSYHGENNTDSIFATTPPILKPRVDKFMVELELLFTAKEPMLTTILHALSHSERAPTFPLTRV